MPFSFSVSVDLRSLTVAALLWHFGVLTEPRPSGSGGLYGKTGFTLPGAQPFDQALARKLRKAWAERDANYKPRTRHLRRDGSPIYTNRLFLESSPYLLQHAHNPTNWYPWGDEAFQEAKRLGRPVLLSVGYSTCHWCHVMEEESFDDVEIARAINENYIAIKVDREERPDIDAIYMTAVQALTGRGGWPMTVWLTPERKPFYGGTYFPARDGDRGAPTGFLTLLRELRKVYQAQPEQISERASQITKAIGRMLEPPAGNAVPASAVLHEAVRYYKARFDATYGGQQGAPKFPSSLPVRFLLRYSLRTGDKQAREMAALTLEKMAQGGIYDHVGGGFHRYSTDQRWLVPHFEKMLYDNALLVLAYLEGYQATGREDFTRVAREVLRYVERDMTSPEGAFYSATDADSPNAKGEREEGWFFTWTPAEIEQVLGPERARIVKACYGVTPAGNFEGRNILSGAGIPACPGQESRDRLYEARKQRPPPLRDEKILTAWNALMISAQARASLTLGDLRYADQAERAAGFVLAKLLRNNRLLRSYKAGQARHDAYLDDYAFLIAALLDLYEASGKLRWLEEAIRLDAVLERHYEDKKNGGFFMTSDDHEQLLAREKPAHDGAEPSGNSVAVMNLLRLHEFTTKDAYRQRALRAFEAFHQVLAQSPAALSEMLLALDFYLDSPKEIIIVTPESRRQAKPLLDQLGKTFVPNSILAVASERTALTGARLVPLFENKRALKGKPTAYVCKKRICELPTTDPEVFVKQISKTERLP